MSLSRWTRLLLWLLQKSNPCRDTALSWELHLIADHYDKRPTGQWENDYE